MKGSEGETRIRVGANPRKSSNRFLNNYKAEFALKQPLYSTNQPPTFTSGSSDEMVLSLAAAAAQT